MRFQVFHRTRYHYRSPVRDSYNELRLRPASDDPTRLQFFIVKVQPPVRLQHFRDSYLNYVHYFDIPEPHVEMVIEAHATVNTTSPYAGGPPPAVPRASLASSQDDLVSEFLNASRYVELSAELWRMAVDVAGDTDDIFTSAVAIMRFIYTGWTYAQNTTTATTHVREVVASRQGVCQDFAHLMIGLCRSIGIPARYVSGYLFNGPGANLRGAQASHAWCEVFIPGHGWFGLDPTNNNLADEAYIKIATGRDYHDAAPISGHFDGPPGATSALQVDVSVEPA